MPTNFQVSQMKNLDVWSKRILTTGLMIIGILLASSLFMLSVHQATASSSNDFTAAPSEEKHILMQYLHFVNKTNQDKFEVLMWDAKTGNSKIYNYDYDKGEFTTVVSPPDNPFD